jgi:tight adherence protein B
MNPVLGLPITPGMLLALALSVVLLAGAATIAGLRRDGRLAARLSALRSGHAADAADPRLQALSITGLQDPRGRAILDRLFGIDRRLHIPHGFRIWQAIAAGVIVSGPVAWVAGSFAEGGLLAAGLLALATVFLVPAAIYRKLRRDTRDRMMEQFPDTMGLIVRSVRAGIPVVEGIRQVARDVPAPTGPEFRRIADDLAIGASLEAALWRSAERKNLPEFRFFLVSVILQRETGGNISEALENLAEVVRKRRMLDRKTAALTSEARASTYVLAALPFFTGTMIYITNPAYIERLFVTPEGKLVLAVAIGLLAAGLLIMKAIVKGIRA